MDGPRPPRRRGGDRYSAFRPAMPPPPPRFDGEGDGPPMFRETSGPLFEAHGCSPAATPRVAIRTLPAHYRARNRTWGRFPPNVGSHSSRAENHQRVAPDPTEGRRVEHPQKDEVDHQTERDSSPERHRGFAYAPPD